ncbi:ATP-binding cassette domain-containing protein [Actinomyces bowdenii]|nr:ATP-binding cassette domain-containing protein [Actinomyces bowdenii]
MLAVTGRTGSGKSILLRILAGLLLPQESGVSWEGTALEAITVGAGPLRRSSTSALDEATTHRVVAHLRELVDDGVGILTATHDPLLIEAAGTVMPLH